MAIVSPGINVLRVLTTNQCNHRCWFCHNEGQISTEPQFLNPQSFSGIVAAAYCLGIRQIQFSGGEPTLHPAFEDLVRTAQNHAPRVGIGMATNGSCLTETLIQYVSPIMNNIRVNLPSLSLERYVQITGVGDLERVLDSVELLIHHGASVGLNTVYCNQSLDEIMALIGFAAAHEIDLKILEWIKPDDWQSSPSAAKLCQELEVRAWHSGCLAQSVRQFLIPVGRKTARVRVILTPCRARLSSACQEYGEVRLLPNLHLQGCVLPGSHTLQINSASATAIITAFKQASQAIGRCPS